MHSLTTTSTNDRRKRQYKFAVVLTILLNTSSSVTAFSISPSISTTSTTTGNRIYHFNSKSIRRREQNMEFAPHLLLMSTNPQTPDNRGMSTSNNDDESDSLEKNTKLDMEISEKSEGKLSFGEMIQASFPEFSFWDVAQGDEARLRKRDLIRSIFRRLANLSLQDYSWRSDYFKKTEADRRVEESMARMMGEDASYIRPMDASDEKIGPLGRAEKTLVEWLALVIEEEGKRARMIASSEGDLVRPMDLQTSGEGGPLSALENSAVSFLNDIRDSEKERAKTMTLRPKDLNEEKRGPLGDLEFRVVRALDEIREAEKLRLSQSRQRGGEVVRPIDVPGPLGELERWYLELITAEKQRSKDREKNDGRIVRPMDSTLQGPMGDAEKQFSDAMRVIKEEEKERLKSIQKVLEENRPMDQDEKGALGWLEALLVGIFRGPQLIFRVIDRVNELLQSSTLNEDDDKILKDKKK